MQKVEILDWTMKDPLNCIGYCAGICWNSNTSMSEKNVKRALKCISDGHGRVAELPDVYVVLDGFSAKCIRELYTHIGGGPTRLQASTRYIDYSKGFDVITPHTVENSEEAKAVWDSTCKNIADAMNKLKDLGIPTEDLTNLLPLAYSTKMVWKVNLRTLLNFMNMRLCSRAYWEIRELSQILRKKLSEYSEEWNKLTKMFVPKCVQLGYCQESDSCGLMPKKNTKRSDI